MVKAPRNPWRIMRYTLFYVALAIVILAGIGAIVRQVSNAFPGPATPATTTAPAPTEDPRVTAAAFTADYLTYNPLAPAAGKAALTAHLPASTDATRLMWRGSGWVATDIVIPGEPVTVDTNRWVVPVTARLRTATPSTTQQDIPPAPATAAGEPANTAPLPAGYTEQPAQWVHLQVPVVASGGAVTVDPAGPVFAPATTITLTNTTSDATASEATRAWAKSFLTAYAGTDTTALDYLTTTGGHIRGLNGGVQLATLTGWQVRSIGDGTVGTATVEWRLPGADTTIAQTMNISMTTSENRWFATNISPAITTPTGGNS